jgi:hypothetical protein
MLSSTLPLLSGEEDESIINWDGKNNPFTSTDEFAARKLADNTRDDDDGRLSMLNFRKERTF